ncbi:hypothetical protein [Enterobacter wuhouensis]|uniref:hypothetical protein n=1 Tax=Enterobacter wuhouensis TaxID=2529381 RepID=UPI003D76F74D
MFLYRYIATAGNFALAPPKEYAYPKIKKPKAGRENVYTIRLKRRMMLSIRAKATFARKERFTFFSSVSLAPSR